MAAPFSSAVLLSLALFSLPAPAASSDPAQLIGTWRGKSICIDRHAAPACQDEVVVYEFSAGAKPDVVHWTADKIVDGQRVNMGELDLTYDAAEKCWRVEVQARLHSLWRLNVNGATLSGTDRLVPGNELIRQVALRRVPGDGAAR